jgi:hypothetical protein
MEPEPGKVADLVVRRRSVEHATHVTHVFVDGRLVYDRAQRPFLIPWGAALPRSAEGPLPGW